MAGQRRSEWLLATEFRENHPVISPDGGWMAYESTESGRPEIYVQRFPELGGKTTVSTDGGIEPLWSSDGRELFYRGFVRPAVMRVSVATDPTFEPGPPEVVFQGPYVSGLNSYDVATDGLRFLMVKPARQLANNAPPPPITVVLNWLSELERLVPTR